MSMSSCMPYRTHLHGECKLWPTSDGIMRFFEFVILELTIESDYLSEFYNCSVRKLEKLAYVPGMSREKVPQTSSRCVRLKIIDGTLSYNCMLQFISTGCSFHCVMPRMDAIIIRVLGNW